MYCLAIQEARILRSRCRKAWLVLCFFLASGGLLAILACFGLWTRHPTLLLSHGFLFALISVFKHPIFIRTEPYWVRVHPDDIILTICKDPIAKKEHFDIFQEDTTQPLAPPQPHLQCSATPPLWPVLSEPHSLGSFNSRATLSSLLVCHHP